MEIAGKNNTIVLTIVMILSFTFLLVSYIPHFYEATVTDIMPPDRMMIWAEHIYTYDYNVYLSKIRQGEEGRWTVVDKYDNNPHQKGVLLQMLYLLGGKIGVIFRLTPALTFHLMRTFLSFFWVITIIYLNIYFLKKPQLYFFGILLSLLASSFPIFYRYLDSLWVGYHMSWWTEMDVLKRISYIPHYTLNYIIVGCLSILLFKFSQAQNSKLKTQSYNSKLKTILSKYLISNIEFLKICVLLFFSFFIHPAAGILFFFSWGLYHLINFLLFKHANLQYLISNIVRSIILLLVAAIPVLYLQHVTSTYPWKSLIDFDKTTRYPVDLKEYILTLGPVFFTGILGGLLVLIKKEKKLLSLVTWVLGAFTAIFVFRKIPFQAELRFVQTANHIPLAILSVYFLFYLKEKLLEAKIPFFRALGGAQERARPLSEKHGIELPKITINFIIYGIIYGIIILGIVQSYFSIKSQTDFIHQRAVAGQPLVPYPPQVMYPLKDFWNTLKWLENNTSRQDVILSQITAGNYIPAYSGNFVYFGHNPETPHYAEREIQLNTFFSGMMTPEDAYRFLQNNNISYVFYGPQEREKAVEDIKKYPFLQPTVTLPYVTLYKVL